MLSVLPGILQKRIAYALEVFTRKCSAYLVVIACVAVFAALSCVQPGVALCNNPGTDPQHGGGCNQMMPRQLTLVYILLFPTILLSLLVDPGTILDGAGPLPPPSAPSWEPLACPVKAEGPNWTRGYARRLDNMMNSWN